MSIMYKVQVLGPQNVLHKYEPLLLSAPVAMLLYLLTCAVSLCSSCVVYMYGYRKFAAFVEQERDRHSIRLREGGSSLWAYFPHCSAMCALIALAVCHAPLLYDFTLVYRGSLDGAVLLHVAATVLHLFLWVAAWLFLTAKQGWSFKLRVTVGRAVVKTSRGVKLVNEVDLANSGADEGDQSMLIVAFGKSYTVSEAAPQRLIMSTLARAAIERDRAAEEEEARPLLPPGTPGTNTTPRRAKREEVVAAAAAAEQNPSSAMASPR